MASSAYIADGSDSNKVYFEVDPVPIPLVNYKPIYTAKQRVNGYSGGAVIPGGFDYYLAGCTDSGAEIAVTVKLMVMATYTAIITRMKSGSVFVFSPDGTRKYKGFIGDGSFSFLEGSATYIQGNFTFKVTEVLA